MIALKILLILEEDDNGTFRNESFISTARCKAEVDGKVVEVEISDAENEMSKKLAQQFIQSVMTETKGGFGALKEIHGEGYVGGQVIDVNRLKDL